MGKYQMKKIRVLHLLCSNRFSGAENVVCQIIHMFSSFEEFEMFYCSPDGQIREALEERNVNYVPIARISVGEIRKAIRVVHPDIIHAHDMRASFFAALACGSIPLVLHIHNNNFDSRKLSVKSVLFLYAAQKAKHIFWVSKSSFEGYAFHDKFTGRSSVLYNVIDADEVCRKVAQDEKEYAYDIVYVGRLTPQKNPQRLIKVLAGIHEKYPQMRAAIVGTGELEEETKEKINEYDVRGCVDMLGFCSNPYKIMKSAKILIMTSRWEGLPMCALEAIALGVPIVSTPTDGLKEIVIDGETGYLCNDDIDLVDRCCVILSNPDLYEKLHRETLNARHLFNIDNYRTQVRKVYAELIDAHDGT